MKKVEDTLFPIKNEENFDYYLIDLTNSGDEDIKIETEANNVEEKVAETKEKAPDEATNQPRRGTYSYEFSQQFLAETTEPFHGFFDATGSNYGTYNTKGDWRNFLTFYEIFQHFNRDYEKLAAEIVKDPSIVINWLEKSNKGTQEELTPFHFRFQSHGNFKFVKKVMLSLGIKIEDDKRKEEKKQRMREKRALERERKEQERLSAEIQEKQEDSSTIPQPEEALKT